MIVARMGYRFFHFTLGFLSSVAMVSAQPGPMTATKNRSLVFPASTLLTNGIPGLSGSPAHLMVVTVQSNSALGGAVSLKTSHAWTGRFNGAANSSDQGHAVVVDATGKILVGGYSTGIGSAGDYLTIKYTPDGVALWTNRYNGPANGDDQIRGVAADGMGGVYVSGDSGNGIATLKYSSNGIPAWTNFYDSSSFVMFTGLAADAVGNAYLLPFDLDTDSFVIVKYNVNGNAVWTNRFRTLPTSNEDAEDIAVDTAGNIFVTGGSFDSSWGGTMFLTVKYASNGSLLWTRRLSLLNLEHASRVIVDPQDNVIVAGYSQNGELRKDVVVKYSNSGTAFWTNRIDAGGSSPGLPEIASDPAGNIFLITGTPGATTADFTTVKYSATGVPLWTNRFVDPNSGIQQFDGAGTDNAGNLYWTISSGSPGGANYNYVTLKYAPNGAVVWTNRYNGPGNSSDLTRAMTVDKAGGVYVTGTSSSGGTGFAALDWATLKYADNLRYVPPTDFVGLDTITFTALNSLGNSATSTVVVNVLPGPTSVVAPDDYMTVAGTGGLNTIVRGFGSPRTYQMQFAPEALGGLPVGARITALRFRLHTNAAAAFPLATVTWPDYEVTLAQAVNPIASMSATFAANLLNPVLVKDGALSVGTDAFTAGENPNAFATFMALDTPYIYQGGDLVMHFTHNGSGTTNTAFLDAATSGPGFGSSFRAFSANSFAAASGTAASVTIVEIVCTPPITQTISHAGTQVIISGAGGSPGAIYRILTATNIALPLSQWMPMVTNQFGISGDFRHTNILQPNLSGRYFRVNQP